MTVAGLASDLALLGGALAVLARALAEAEELRADPLAPPVVPGVVVQPDADPAPELQSELVTSPVTPAQYGTPGTLHDLR